MKHWSEQFHNELRETFHPGQIDLFQELDVCVPFRPNVRCKKCAKPWNGEDARTSPAKAKQRGVWWVSNKRSECADCLQESK